MVSSIRIVRKPYVSVAAAKSIVLKFITHLYNNNDDAWTLSQHVNNYYYIDTRLKTNPDINLSNTNSYVDITVNVQSFIGEDNSFYIPVISGWAFAPNGTNISTLVGSEYYYYFDYFLN